MKKIPVLGIILALFTLAASAQTRDDNRVHHYRELRVNRHRQLSHFERRHLRHDEFRYRIARRRTHRDGFVGPFQRRRLAMMRIHNRRELYRLDHYNHRRLI